MQKPPGGGCGWWDGWWLRYVGNKRSLGFVYFPPLVKVMPPFARIIRATHSDSKAVARVVLGGSGRDTGTKAAFDKCCWTLELAVGVDRLTIRRAVLPFAWTS